MEIVLLIIIICMFVLYFIIKLAVSKGIDSAKSIKELKMEVIELKQQIKRIKMEEQNKEDIRNIINKKV